MSELDYVQITDLVSGYNDILLVERLVSLVETSMAVGESAELKFKSTGDGYYENNTVISYMCPQNSSLPITNKDFLSTFKSDFKRDITVLISTSGTSISVEIHLALALRRERGHIIVDKPAKTYTSALNYLEFRCARGECISEEGVEIKIEEGDATLQLAESKKRSANQEPDQLLKMIMYIESAVYFAMSSLSSPNQYNLIKDLCEMIKFATNRFISKDLTPLMQHLAHITRSLSLRVQSVLLHSLYQKRIASVWKHHHIVDEYKDYRPVPLPAGDKPNDDVSGAAAVQQSPASSVHSSSNSGASRMVSIPEKLFDSFNSEVKHASRLMYAHQLWDDAVLISGRSETDRKFFNCLESVCGHLCVNTPVKKMAIFVITGITWLRKEYELEKQRPQPPGESKCLSSGSSHSQNS